MTTISVDSLLLVMVMTPGMMIFLIVQLISTQAKLNGQLAVYLTVVSEYFKSHYLIRGGDQLVLYMIHEHHSLSLCFSLPVSLSLLFSLPVLYDTLFCLFRV